MNIAESRMKMFRIEKQTRKETVIWMEQILSRVTQVR